MPHPNAAVIVRHPDGGVLVALDPSVDYDPGDVLVSSYPWAFTPRETGPGVIESVAVEQATAAPGEKRAIRRPRSQG